jgi:GntR family transcriptional regulator, arabinose operon transcriptional repressor
MLAKKEEIPVYLKVKQGVEDLITRGVLTGGGLVPSDRELAKQFGASLVTVQRAVNMLAAEGKVRRMPRKGTTVVHTAKPSKPADRNAWAVLVPTMDYFYPQILQEIEKETRRMGITVSFGCVGGSLELERRMIFQKIEEGVSGIILAPASPHSLDSTASIPPCLTRPPGTLGYLAELPVPLVVIDHFGTDMPNIGVDYVVKDDFAGAYQSTVHLIRHGYKKIGAFMARSPKVPSEPYEGSQRRKGYETAMADHNLPLPEFPMLRAWDIDYNPEAIKRYLDAGCNAFVLGDDGSAALLIRLLGRWGVKVPDQVAMIGYDDEPFCRVIDPPLSSVRIPKVEMAHKAVQLLAERIESRAKGNYRSIILKPTVVARASCGINCPQAKSSVESVGLFQPVEGSKEIQTV